jgi:membrane-associated protein
MFFPIEETLCRFGYIALFSFVFAESGLFLGFFLPGDSLLFTAGILAARDFFDLKIVLLGTFLCAFLGDLVGYWTGKHFGPTFFSSPRSFFRNPKHMEKAKEFYLRHGKKAIVLARFVPVVRTFAPILAGTVLMDYSTFVKYNAIGGAVWCLTFVGAGYILGNVLPESEDILTFIISSIIIISLIPIAAELYSDWNDKMKKQFFNG